MRKFTITDPVKLKEVLDRWRTETANAPTSSSLLRYIGLKSPCSLYVNMDRDDDCGDLLKEAYNHIIEFHETRLCGEKNCTNSIFLIKTYKRLGWSFRDDFVDTSVSSKSGPIVFEIVEKKTNDTETK